MSSSCSLLLTLSKNNDTWSWQIFHRHSGKNPSIASQLPIPRAITPKEINSSFDQSVSSENSVALQKCGIEFYRDIFPEAIKNEIEKADSGNILFMVPPEWADIPFELFYSPRKGYLGQKFRIGTIISINKESQQQNKVSANDSKILIISNPDDNLNSADKEVQEISKFLGKKKQRSHLLNHGDKERIHQEIEISNIVHFAGHSFSTGDEFSTGWKIGKDTIYDITDIKQLETSPIVPWLIFSNSCHAGNTGGTSDLSGIAGAFMKAGVSQVIGPIKKVNDEEAFYFALNFYEYLLKGFTPSDAMLCAKRRRIKKNPNDITVLLYRLFGDPRFSKAETQEESTTLEIASKARKWKSWKVIVVAFALIAIIILLLYWVMQGGNNIIYIPPR